MVGVLVVEADELAPGGAGRVVFANAAVLEARDLAADVGLEDFEVKRRGGGGARDFPDAQAVGAFIVEGDVVGDVEVAVVVGAEEVGFVDAFVVRGGEADAGEGLA